MFFITNSLYKLRKFDLFGRYLTFTDDHSQKHYTSVGFLLTTMIIVFVTVIGIIYGSEVVSKKNGNITISDETVENSQIYLRDLPIMMSFTNINGFNINNAERYFNVKNWDFRIDENLQVGLNITMGLVKCDPNNFTPGPSRDFIMETLAAREAQNFDSYCFNDTQNTFIQNTYGGFNSSFQSMEVILCDPVQTECPDDIEIVSKAIFVSLAFPNYYVNSQEYDNPIQISHSNEITYCDNFFKRRLLLSFTNDLVITDKGWIFEDLKKESYISLYKVKNEILLKGEDNGIFSILLQSPRNVKVFTRKYMKIQDLLGNIGGFIDCLFFLFHILIGGYVDFKFNIHTYHNIISKLSISKDKFKMIEEENENEILNESLNDDNNNLNFNMLQNEQTNSLNYLNAPRNRSNNNFNKLNASEEEDNSENQYKNLRLFQKKDGRKSEMDILNKLNQNENNNLSFSNTINVHKDSCMEENTPIQKNQEVILKNPKKAKFSENIIRNLNSSLSPKKLFKKSCTAIQTNNNNLNSNIESNLKKTSLKIDLSRLDDLSVNKTIKKEEANYVHNFYRSFLTKNSILSKKQTLNQYNGLNIKLNSIENHHQSQNYMESSNQKIKLNDFKLQKANSSLSNEENTTNKETNTFFLSENYFYYLFSEYVLCSKKYKVQFLMVNGITSFQYYINNTMEKNISDYVQSK